MKKLNDTWQWLKGKKTYVLAASAALTASAGFLTALASLLGGDLTFSEFLDDPSVLVFWGAMGLATVRHGIDQPKK